VAAGVGVGLGPSVWAGGAENALHHSLAHMIAETLRHVGHADIVRELIDGATGRRRNGANTADGDPAWWAAHRERVERAARDAGGRA
jgi:hypothetical protein